MPTRIMTGMTVQSTSTSVLCVVLEGIGLALLVEAHHDVRRAAPARRPAIAVMIDQQDSREDLMRLPCDRRGGRLEAHLPGLRSRRQGDRQWRQRNHAARRAANRQRPERSRTVRSPSPSSLPSSRPTCRHAAPAKGWPSARSDTTPQTRPLKPAAVSRTAAAPLTRSAFGPCMPPPSRLCDDLSHESRAAHDDRAGEC